MKKALAILLALAMCMSFMPMAAGAAAGGRISLDKTDYAPWENITVTISGLTQEQINDDVNGVTVALFDEGGVYHRENRYQ